MLVDQMSHQPPILDPPSFQQPMVLPESNEFYQKADIEALINRLKGQNASHQEIISTLQPYIEIQNKLSSDAYKCLNDFIIQTIDQLTQA